MRKDRFTDEALRNAYALAELKYSENPEDQVAFEEAYDFARCQRPDGSFYGTSGQCRKGKESGAKAVEPKTKQAPKSSGVSNEQAMKLRASLTKQIGEAAKSGDQKKTDNLMQALAAVEGQLKARGVDLSKGGGPSRTASQLTPKEQAARAERQKAGEANRQAQAGAAAAAKAAAKTGARRGNDPEMKAKDNELRGQIKDKMAQQKERKAELDRIDRAFKAQEKLVKKEPTKDNKERLKRVRTALIQQERFYNRGERELEKMGRERMRLQQKMERARMSPAQRAEDRRVRAIIKERG